MLRDDKFASAQASASPQKLRLKPRCCLEWGIDWGQILGVYMGSVASARRLLDKQRKIQPELQPTDCISVFLEGGVVTLHAASALLRYDLLIAVSWLSQEHRPHPLMLPLDKRKR